jgi:ATP-dependent helicase/DNAse subunit B
LEEYALCPYRFFLNNVLHLEELPNLGLEIDFGRRGQLAHSALAELHRRLNAAGTPQSPVDVGAKKLGALTDETIAVLIEQLPKGSPLEVALRTIDLQLLTQWMQGYFAQHEKYDAAAGELDQPLRPAHFEVSFGLKRRGDVSADPTLFTEKPFDLSCGEETIRFSGRIDRIDIGLVGDEVVFNILDYKTGSKKRLSADDLAAGLALQLPIYALAVQELLMIDRRAKPWRVGYWYLKEKGFHADDLPQFFERGEEGLQETGAWRELRQTLLARVVTLVRSIRSGMFPVFSLDDECTSRCPYRTVCRVGQVRALDKQWSSPEGVAVCSAGTNSP